MPEALPPPAGVIPALQHWARSCPGQPALRFIDDQGGQATLGYGELAARAAAGAARLQPWRGTPQPVLVVMEAGLDFAASFLACLAAGVLAVPVAVPRNERQARVLAAIAAVARPALAIVQAGVLERAHRWLATDPVLAEVEWLTSEDLLAPLPGASAESWAAPDPAGVAYLQFTSGSTTRPRGVEISHANVTANVADISVAFGARRETVSCSWLPHYHDMGLIAGVLAPLSLGGTSVLMSPLGFLARPRLWLETIERFGAEISGGPNFAYDLCVSRIREADRAGLDLSRWRLAFTGAEPVRARTLAQFADAFSGAGFRPRALYPCYGLAEATLWVSGRLDGLEGVRERAPGGAAGSSVSCGRWHATTDLQIVGDDGTVVPGGAVGEIWISGPGVARAYHGDDAASRATFGHRLPGLPGAYLRTGDLGCVVDGELFVLGRRKEMAIFAGRNLYFVDVEEAVREELPPLATAAVACFAIDDGQSERIVVLIELPRRPTWDPAQARQQLQVALSARFGCGPVSVEWVRHGELPRTTSGKLRRGAIREGFLAGSFGTAGAVAADVAP